MNATVSGANLSLRPSMTRVIVAASIGNMLEWYDFIVYAMFAIPISHAFFPGKTDFTSLLETFITFGVGFLARPLGAIIFGTYADRTGRRAALTLTVLLMALSTLVIATCPTAATIGIAAPTLLVLARLLQGLSAGGEIGGAIALLVEYAPPSRRAFYSTFQEVGQGGALLLCGIIATIVTTCFSKRQVNEWAWRIPFLFGLLIAPVGFYIRRHLPESDVFIAHESETTQGQPARLIFTEHWKALLAGIGMVVAGTVGTYVTLYIPTYASTILKLPQSNAYIGLIVVGIVVMLCPAAGIFADRFGQKPVMFFALVCLIVYPYPAFRYLTAHPSGGALITVQVIMALFLTIYLAPTFAFMAELFPTTVRSTGTGLAYGLGVTIFGGFTPTMVSMVVHSTGSKLAVAFWLMASAAISAVSLVATHDRSQQRLT
jgi:MFS transporter, MHS family, proline/betaine transporter